MHEFHRPPRWKDSELLIPCSKLSQNEQDLGFYGLSRLWLSAFWSELPFTLLWWFKAGEEIFSFYATAWVWRMCKKGTAETGIRKELQKTGIRYVAASKSRPKKAAAICLAWCFWLWLQFPRHCTRHRVLPSPALVACCGKRYCFSF